MENNSQEKISIIVPVYNAEKYLEKCADSILGQTYTNLEVIFVDDGSTDGSRDIMDSYARRDGRVITVFKNNGGPNSARKAGIMQATGSHAMFVDADDYIDSEMCEILINVCAEHSAVMAGCGLKRLEYDGMIRNVKLHKTGRMSGKSAALNLFDTSDFYKYNFGTTLCGYLFDTKTIRSILADIDKKIAFAEDVMCMFLALWDSEIVYILNDYLYTYVIHTESQTHNHKKRYYESQKALYRYGRQEFQKRQMPGEMYVSLEQLIIACLLISGYREAFGHLDYLFPFLGVKNNMGIIVYGAGSFGIELVDYIIESGKYKLIAWIDKNYKNITMEGHQIEKPTSLIKYEYDYVVIAATKSKVSNQIVQELLGMGVERQKIKTIQPELISYNALPDSFFEKESE